MVSCCCSDDDVDSKNGGDDDDEDDNDEVDSHIAGEFRDMDSGDDQVMRFLVALLT